MKNLHEIAETRVRLSDWSTMKRSGTIMGIEQRCCSVESYRTLKVSFMRSSALRGGRSAAYVHTARAVIMQGYQNVRTVCFAVLRITSPLQRESGNEVSTHIRTLLSSRCIHFCRKEKLHSLTAYFNYRCLPGRGH